MYIVLVSIMCNAYSISFYNSVYIKFDEDESFDDLPALDPKEQVGKTCFFFGDFLKVNFIENN